MRKKSLLLMLIIPTLLILGCSSDDNDPTPEPVQQNPDPEPDPEPEVLTGVFIDSPVEGLAFETTTQAGVTNDKGEFSYVAGEEVIFKVGEIVLGTAPGQEMITPITLAQTENSNATIESSFAQNIAALLQTLDSDGDQSNGITISSEVANNLGVTNIDFSQPVENVLADIVINLSQNLGLALEVVYPSEAAESMANSLEIEFTAPENFILTHFLPAMRGFYATQTPPSTVYRNSFDNTGSLMQTEIVLRYSGRVVRTFSYSGHGNDGQPSIISYPWEGGLFVDMGRTPPLLSNTVSYTITYDGDHYINKITRTDIDFVSEYLFNSFDESNRPLQWDNMNTSADGIHNYTYSYQAVYEDDRVKTFKTDYDSVFDDQSNLFYSEYTSTSTSEYAYDGNNNFTSISGTSNWERNAESNGNPIVQSGSSNFQELFEYGGNRVLSSFERNSTNTSDGVSNTSLEKLLFDENGYLTSRNIEYDTGFSSQFNYENGVLASIKRYLQNSLSEEVEYDADGSYAVRYYYYDDNNNLVDSTKEYFEFISEGNYGRYNFYRFDYYDSTGNLLYYFLYENDAEGRRIMADYYESGELLWTYTYEYDADGLLKKENVFDADGQLTFYWIYEYDENFSLSTISGYRPDDTLQIVYFYEDGVYIGFEEYDENGSPIGRRFTEINFGRFKDYPVPSFDVRKKSTHRGSRFSIKNHSDLLGNSLEKQQMK